MSGRRKDYLKDYELRDSGGKSTVIYTGTAYKLNIDAQAMKKQRVCLLCLDAAMIALFIACGIVPVPGINMVYVLLPYAITFMPLIYSLKCQYALFRKDALNRKAFENITERLPRNCVTIMIFSSASLLGSLWYGISHQAFVEQLPFTAVIAAYGILSFILRRQVLMISQRIEKVEGSAEQGV